MPSLESKIGGKMSGEWIPIPTAIVRYAAERRVKHNKAVAAVARLCENNRIASRIRSISAEHHRGPTANVVMVSKHWNQIWDLQSDDWYREGKAFFPDGTVWHDLQLNETDLERKICAPNSAEKSGSGGVAAQRGYVELAEALSWIALGKLHDRDQLEFALSQADGAELKRQLESALSGLTEKARSEGIGVRGRYIADYRLATIDYEAANAAAFSLDPSSEGGPSARTVLENIRQVRDEVEALERRALSADELSEFRQLECQLFGLQRGSGVVTDPHLSEEGFIDVLVNFADLLGAYPAQAEAEAGPVVRQKPGPKPHRFWKSAIVHATQKAKEKGIKAPLERGDRAKIERMLCAYMDERIEDGVSPSSARTYAKQVIERLEQR